MAPPSSSADRRQQFLTAVKNQKLDSVRWALTHGGQTPGTRDDDGFTAIHIAAASNKPKVLQLMLDMCRRSRELELIDLRDGEGDEMTALMMAAANGFEACVKELLYAGAKPTLTCAQGLTAEAWARKRGHVALADLIARGGEDESESEDEAEACAEDSEETSTQRSRRKKRELAAFESRGAKLKAVPSEPPPEEEEEASGGAAAAAAAPPGDAPTWPEVARALEAAPKELLLERDAGGGADVAWVVDPALWRCTSVNLLKLSLHAPGGDAAAPRPLRALPDGVRFLTGLRTLILSNNALESLPDAIGACTGLKVFEAAFNALTCLPPSFGQLSQLETLLLSHNALSSVAPLAALTNLTSVTLDANALSSLEDMGLAKKPRLALLAVRSNALRVLPAAVGDCALLQTLQLRGNALRDVPFELCGLKKLRELELEDNPLDDPKIKKMIQKPASLIKELTPYLKKRGKVAPPADAPPTKAPPPAGAAAAAAKGGESSDEEAEEEEEAPKGGRALSKKERAKLERKALEEKQKAAAAALKERAAAQAAAAAAAAAGSEESAEDDDDDEAALARRRPPTSGFAYALDPAERERLEREEAEALRQRRAAEAEAEAEKARTEAQKAEAEAERKLRAASLKDAHADAGVAWAFAAGTLVKAPPGTPLPPGAAGRGGAGRGAAPGRGAGGPPGAGRAAGAPEIYDVWVEIPQLVVGRIIGKAGATIKEITARSGARVSVDNGATAGMALLHAFGRPEALESARMLINNALAPKAR